jgi:nitrate/nitrite transporter NarK
MHPVVPALIAMLAVQILTSMTGTTGSVLAPVAAPDLGVQTYLVGVYVGIIYGVGALSSGTCAGFIARFGAIRVSQVCMLLCASGLALGALGQVWSAVLGAVLIGVAYGPSPVASSHILARLTPPSWMNLIFSIKQTGVPIGTGLSGLLLPSLAVALGWQGATLIFASLCLLAAIAIQRLRASLDSDRDPSRPLFALASLSSAVRLVSSDPDMRRLSIISFAYAGMQTILSAFLVTFLSSRMDMAIVLAGIVLAISQGSGALARVIWGFTADRGGIDPVRLLAGLGIAMSVIALVTGVIAPDWPFVLVVLVCASFGATAAGWNGVFLAQLARLAPGRVSEAAGGSHLATFGGVMVLPPVFSLILAATGSYAIGFAVVAALTFAGGLWLLMVPMRRA